MTTLSTFSAAGTVEVDSNLQPHTKESARRDGWDGEHYLESLIILSPVATYRFCVSVVSPLLVILMISDRRS